MPEGLAAAQGQRRVGSDGAGFSLWIFRRVKPTPQAEASPLPAMNRLLEVENIQNYFRAAIPEHDVASDHDAFAIRRWWWHPAVQIDGYNHYTAFQIPRKCSADHQSVFQIGG